MKGFVLLIDTKAVKEPGHVFFGVPSLAIVTGKMNVAVTLGVEKPDQL